MEDESIEIRYKRWVRILSYLWLTSGLLITVYALHDFLITGSGKLLFQPANIIVYFILGLSLTATVVGIPYVHSAKIRIDSEGIRKVGLLPVDLRYDNINRIKVRKGGIEVSGENLWEIIRFGDLFDDFETARAVLGSQLRSHNHIEIQGEAKFLDDYVKN